ncbi:hypothetical protein EGR_11276 [Echinococcus granulosus]|uniref:Uncharacterized protein n=1 Tax=Echinococcus granulosus TaxID=6210 RepID=W6TYS0_ECHGR|nr:hypothetical protein EGR_11276 [Echinococcus granulosus]EUB53873.1 hypothetical protein EGR_11276 [Echinococcus granulosus]
MHIIKAKHPYVAVFNSLPHKNKRNDKSKGKVFWVKEVAVSATNIYTCCLNLIDVLFKSCNGIFYQVCDLKCSSKTSQTVY